MSSRSLEKKWPVNNRLSRQLDPRHEGSHVATSGSSGPKSLFRDRQLPLVKGLSVRVLAFGTVKFRQVVKAW
jgi:hypothetical protein